MWILFLNFAAIALLDVVRNVLLDRKQIYLKRERGFTEQLIEMEEK